MFHARIGILLVVFLFLDGCASHLDMPRNEVEQKIVAWEALKHELSELLISEAITITGERLSTDATDWNLLALELNALQQQRIMDAADLDRGSQALLMSMGYPSSGVTKKGKVQRGLASLESHLSIALNGMAQANKRFMQTGDLYILDEAYNVGIWAIDKYTSFLRERSRYKEPLMPIPNGRASKVLRELYGI